MGDLRFIGRAAARRAVAAGHAVSVLHRGKYPPSVQGARHLECPREVEPLRAAIARTEPEVLVDTAAMTGADAHATVDAAPEGLPLVVLSSQDVYAQFGRLLGHPLEALEDEITETSPLTVPYPYRGIGAHRGGDAYDKKDVESVFVAAGATVLRLPAVYGTHDSARRFGWVVDRLDAGDRALPMAGGAGWRWTHAHVTDVAEAIRLAAVAAGSGSPIYNVGEAHTPTMRARCDAIAGAMDVEIDWHPGEVPEALRYLGEQPNHVVVSSAALRRDLGFAEVTTEGERLADLVDWLRRSRAA